MNARLKGAPRVVCDPRHGLLLGAVDLTARPETVFRALTDSTEIVRWWGSAPTYRTTKHTADWRVGGRWRSEGLSAVTGRAFSVEGEFLAIDPPSEIAYTWLGSWDEGQVTTVTFRLEGVGEGTRLTLRHEGFGHRAHACRREAEGWEEVLGFLSTFVNAPSPLSAFFCRLIPPRPTFAADMNADERAVMMQHVVYWSEKLAAGSVLVLGPVADPSGDWGLGVFLASDLDELHALQSQDPAILSGPGFHYETLPLRRAKY